MNTETNFDDILKKHYKNWTEIPNQIKDNYIEPPIENEKEEKINKTSKMVHYKNTIPNNFNKNMKKNKTYRKEEKNNIIDNKINNNFDLTSYYPSPISHKELNDNLIIRKFSNQNSEIINSEKTRKSSQYEQNNVLINKNKINLSPYNKINNHYISKTGMPTFVLAQDYPQNNKKKSNSFKFLPKNECSLKLEGIKNKTNINSKRNEVLNSINRRVDRISYASVNKNIPLNSFGLVDNSLSTNFIERPSINENTLSMNDYNQFISLCNKNKNISYTLPSKEISSSPRDEKIKNKNRIYFKKISTNNSKKFQDKNQKRIYNRIIIENKFDNVNSNTINTDSLSKKPKIKNNKNLKVKLDEFKINNDLMGEKNNKNYLRIASGEVNEIVKNIKKKKENTSLNQKSESLTIQSMNDSKILEIANYYLNEEETVDKIEVDDILSIKNNKNNCNLKEN